MLVARGPLAAERLATRHSRAELLVDSAALLARFRGAVGNRARLVPAPAFDDSIEAEFDMLAGTEAPLLGGGRLPDPPDPGADCHRHGCRQRGRGTRRPWRGDAELEALPELARQIRARNLGGAIMVDFAGLSPKRREAPADPLREALAADRQARLLDSLHLGLAEIVRDRVHSAA